jgi:hypothetical protein
MTMKEVSEQLGIDESRVSQTHSAPFGYLRSRVQAMLHAPQPSAGRAQLDGENRGHSQGYFLSVPSQLKLIKSGYLADSSCPTALIPCENEPFREWPQPIGGEIRFGSPPYRVMRLEPRPFHRKLMELT